MNYSGLLLLLLVLSLSGTFSAPVEVKGLHEAMADLKQFGYMNDAVDPQNPHYQEEVAEAVRGFQQVNVPPPPRG